MRCTPPRARAYAGFPLAPLSAHEMPPHAGPSSPPRLSAGSKPPQCCVTRVAGAIRVTGATCVVRVPRAGRFRPLRVVVACCPRGGRFVLSASAAGARGGPGHDARAVAGQRRRVGRGSHAGRAGREGAPRGRRLLIGGLYRHRRALLASAARQTRFVELSPVAAGVLRFERYRRAPQRFVRGPGQCQPELRAAAGLSPCLQPAAVEPRVLQGDGEPQTGAAGGTRACRVGAPEPAEDAGGLAGLESDAVVAHGDGDGAARGGEFDDDVLALAVFDGVDDQVAQDPLHAPGVGFGDDGLLVADDAYGRPLAFGERRGPADDPAHDLPEVDRLGLQGGGAGVEAADLQEVREQCLEPVELVGEQFRGPCGDGVEVDPGVVDDVGGHAYGRQRRAQFVRDVGHEPPLHA